MSQWHALASVADVPADEGRCFQVKGREIAVFRWDDGFVAMDNECPHRGGPLADGALAGNEVVCPWHGWAFNCDTGRSPVNPDVRVQVYPVRVEGQELQIELQEDQ